jgi:5-methylcytosine-specific restriction endonuclease McrA
MIWKKRSQEELKMSNRGYQAIILEPAKSRIKQGLCPVCGKPKSEWKRRKDWTCCSTTCTEEFRRSFLVQGWEDLRLKVLQRDNFKCVKCDESTRRELEVDHIIPIALGGAEWDMDNLQTLCIEHHKEKTREDIAKLAQVTRGIKDRQDAIDFETKKNLYGEYWKDLRVQFV